jgi:O-antigen/teichoic acid export membrane protein
MKDIALSTIARVLVIILQLINVKLYTNYLDAGQLGIYFFLLSVSYSANALLFVPVDYYQQANLAKVMHTSGGIRPLLHFNAKLAWYYISFVLLLVAVIAAVKPDYAIATLLAAMLAYALYAVQALRNALNNLEHRSYVSVSFVQEAVIKVVVFFLLVKYFQTNWLLLIIAWVISLVLTGCYLVYKANRHQLLYCSCEYKIHAKEVFSFSYPFSIGAVCNWLQLQGYRLILVPLGFAEEVGVFATLSSIGSAAIGAASLIYNQQFTPLIYKTAGLYTSRYIQGAFVVILGVTLASIGLGEFMVKVLTNPDFVQHWALLLFGVVTDGANLIIGALVIHVTLKSDSRKIIAASLGGLVGVALCFGLLYWADKISTATIGIPLLVSQWIAALLLYLIYTKIERKQTAKM